MKFLIMLLMVAPLHSRAELIKPESTVGRILVHKLAEDVSRTFVSQTDALWNKKSGGRTTASAGLFSSCEGARKALLTEFAALEVSGSKDLLAAKAALEKAVCPKAPGAMEVMGPPSGAGDIHQAHDHFFAATAYLRSYDNFN